MSDLLDLMREGIAFANVFTREQRIQAQVTHRKGTVSSGSGDITLGPPVVIDALVEYKQRDVRDRDGNMSKSESIITILDPTIVVGEDDEFTLPDGTTGPILGKEGIFDRETKDLMFTVVYLGQPS
jgi:hypothetical protein